MKFTTDNLQLTTDVLKHALIYKGRADRFIQSLSVRKVILKKSIVFALLLSMLVQLILPYQVAYAQNTPVTDEIENSLQNLSDGAASASAIIGNYTILGNSIENALHALSDTNGSARSAHFQLATKIRELYKKTFGVKEKVSVIIENPTSEKNITTIVKDANGKQVNVKVETIERNNSLIVSVLPPASFRPGKYTVEIEDTKANEKIIQNFSWGVLAINTDKSKYTPGETAEIALAVLDEMGIMVCDALVNLRIVSEENGIDDLLTSENGDIKVNPECNLKDFTLTPDYEAEYKVGGKGKYEMALSAETKNGTHTIEDYFVVDDEVRFDIKRSGPTRIYPPHNYPVEIEITASEDFNGTIVEMVPESFEVEIDENDETTDFDNVSIGTGGIQPNSNVLGAATSTVLPFEGSHKVTSLFGEEVTDSMMKEKYQEFGVIGHDGIDFDMPSGTRVLAVESGEVVYSEEEGDYGTTVVLQHSWGKSYYGHLSKILVGKGQKVDKGTRIGLSGNTGLSSGPHLHFGIKLNDNNPKNGYYGKIDPSSILGITNITEILGVGTRSEDSVKMIMWDLSIEKGETVNIGYSFKAPLISPQFYTTGPLRLYKNDRYIYGETRLWQIAADDTAVYSVTDGSSTASTVSGACDTSLTNSTVSDGAQGTVIFSTCVGRNDVPVVKWNKTLTWESMGIPAGSTITQVDGSYKYRVAQETHAATQVMGAMQLRNSGDTADCAASDLEASFDPGAVNASFTTRNSSGNINVSAGCQSSSTSVTIRLNMSPVTGNNNSATSQLRADDIQLSITYTPPAPNLTQAHYRWRNDDGNEANATFRRAEDTVLSRDKSIVMRLRLSVSNEGTASATSTTYRLEYGTLSTTCGAIVSWTAVPASPTTEHFDIEADASGISDGSATSNVTTGGGLTDENTTFVAGQFKDTGNTTSGITLTTTQFTELEYALQANTNASTGTTYCFRVTNAGSTTNFTYNQYAEWTVGEPTMNQNHYRWRNDDGFEASGANTYFYRASNVVNFPSHTFVNMTGCAFPWECVNEVQSTQPQLTEPTSDGASTYVQSANGTERYTISSLPTNATITSVTIHVWAGDLGNPNTTMTLGYCFSCTGSNNVMGTGQAVNNATFVKYSETFSGLSISSSQAMQIVVQASGVNAGISTVYAEVTYTKPATWKQNEDTPHTGQAISENIRLRVEVANTGAVSAIRRPRLEYAERTGASCGDEVFAAVPTSAGSEFQMTDSTYITNGGATTTQLTATGSFTAGQILDTANAPASGFSIANGNYTEMEYNFIASSASSGKIWCFKLTDNGTDLDTYSSYPVLTMAGNSAALNQLLRHGAWFNSSGAEQPFTF